MIQYKKIFMTLAAMLCMTAGAWAQDTDPQVNWDAATKTASFTMPGGNVELQVEYYPESNIFLGKEALADKTNFVVKNDGMTLQFGEDGKSANTVAETSTVTAQYTGGKKILGMKAEKKAAAVSLIVNPEVGQIIGSDGKNYDANATLPTGVTAVAKICYVGSDNGEAAPYNHGLALAMSDANSGNSCTWKTSKTDAGHTKQTSSTFTEESGLQYNDATHNSDTYPAFKAAIANNGTAAPTGCSAWFLASGYQWKKMIDATGLSNLGLQRFANYWSSTECNAIVAWLFSSNDGDWNSSLKDDANLVRACLAF